MARSGSLLAEERAGERMGNPRAEE